ncbi:MAG TPA: hypothetical protein PL048_15605 [Leptospiraceae bacterium]|nr:hypothetical protein [Leptospiraceae bacterium]HMY69732.1 hypothetical protein [Leptospiraceae bacterium]HMZ60201.1 hypothetical protein [Leptospiraceae bacterium]HNF17639.1 hypothetical protein [Leptospiraceae bacterium]HNH10895.1 hypothetical protein [Leptospiraceae bacterium]
METLILEISDPKDKEVILLLAERLHCKVVSSEDKSSKKNSAKAFKHLENIAKIGNLKKSIPDPVKWQKEIRKDRKLPGR